MNQMAPIEANNQETAPIVLPYRFARRHGMLVRGDQKHGEAHILVRGQADPLALMELTRMVGRVLPVRQVSAERFDIALSDTYGGGSVGMEASTFDEVAPEESLENLLDDGKLQEDLLDNTDDAPIIRLLNGVIAEAVRMEASDIHIEPFEDDIRVRFRLDGVMRERLTLARRIAPFLTSRVKVMARLDIAEKRVPQDGRISLSLGDRTLDLRVSVLPSHYGERVVMRILDQGRARLELSGLGMPPLVLSGLEKALQAPNGIILVTGPTGSGKTTTLYGGLSRLNDRTRNILTVEDPIEYGLDGIGQTQIHPKAGLTFASGLRAILRQDPDIVMIGEIRDPETAGIAVQASLTGHLVLSTVHTNSASAALTRLRDFGIEPFLLASGISAVMAQRLVRRLCSECRVPYAASQIDLEWLGIKDQPDREIKLWDAPGCAVCGQTGHAGRLGLYELIIPDTRLRRMIHDNASQSEIDAYAFAQGGRLQDQAVDRVLAGDISLAEMIRIVGGEESQFDGGV